MATSEIERAEALADAVRSVWRTVLPAEPFDLDATWRDAGVDSLKGMEIALRIEREIGTPVPFDLLTQDVTLGEFLRLLAERSAAAGPAGVPVFLVPGVYGDGPGLAEFRSAVAARARVTVLELPDIDAPTSILGGLEATAAGVVGSIVRLQPSGDIRLTGYSYGAFVAQEAARQLEAAGRRVSFLCVIDGGADPKAATPDAALTGPRRRGDVRRLLDLLALKILCRVGLWGVARRRALAAGRRADWRWGEMARRTLLLHLRGVSVLRHPPRPCAAPTLLIMSDDFPRASALRRWRAACPDLEAVSISAGHVSMFEPRSLGELASLFLKGLERASSRARGG